MASRAGVSKGAVSFALNGRPGVAADTRLRILRAADELGWRPNARARALSESRARAVGLVMSRPAGLLAADPFFARFIAGVESVLSQCGMPLLLQIVKDGTAEVDSYRRLAHEARVDGVFLTDVRTDDPRVDLLQELGLPAISAQPTHDPALHWVGIDDQEGIADAVAYLAGLGHRLIGHAAGPHRYVHSTSRRAAFQQACATLYLQAGPTATGDFTAAGGGKVTLAMLQLPCPPTAIVYANDLMAVGGMQAAQSMGLRIPEDLSVVGYDDIPLAPHLSPALTTISADVDLLGRTCATALLDLIEGRTVSGGWLDPPRLVRRASTAPPGAAAAAMPTEGEST